MVNDHFRYTLIHTYSAYRLCIGTMYTIKHILYLYGYSLIKEMQLVSILLGSSKCFKASVLKKSRDGTHGAKLILVPRKGIFLGLST